MINKVMVVLLWAAMFVITILPLVFILIGDVPTAVATSVLIPVVLLLAVKISEDAGL